eukprot:COSAG06_NODE_2051_length_7730_cov_3.256582_2_plen_236_part_00
MSQHHQLQRQRQRQRQQQQRQQQQQRRRLGALASHIIAAGSTAADAAVPGCAAAAAAAAASAASPTTVACTGAAGYVGAWIVRKSLQRGWSVRACVRNVDDERKTAFLKAMQAEYPSQLSLHAADMSVAGAYDAIFRGCDAVFHPAEVMMTFAPGRDVGEATANLKKGMETTGTDAMDAIAMQVRILLHTPKKKTFSRTIQQKGSRVNPKPLSLPRQAQAACTQATTTNDTFVSF